MIGLSRKPSNFGVLFHFIILSLQLFIQTGGDINMGYCNVNLGMSSLINFQSYKFTSFYIKCSVIIIWDIYDMLRWMDCCNLLRIFCSSNSILNHYFWKIVQTKKYERFAINDLNLVHLSRNNGLCSHVYLKSPKYSLTTISTMIKLFLHHYILFSFCSRCNCLVFCSLILC